MRVTGYLPAGIPLYSYARSDRKGQSEGVFTQSSNKLLRNLRLMQYVQGGCIREACVCCCPLFPVCASAAFTADATVHTVPARHLKKKLEKNSIQ